jgi:hypothetical protein
LKLDLAEFVTPILQDLLDDCPGTSSQIVVDRWELLRLGS